MTCFVAFVDGTGPFGLIFPDAPGCVAMGKSVEDVIRQGAEVLAEWIGDVLTDGRRPPKPRTVEQLRKDPDVVDDLANGSFFVSIPLVMDIGRSARANISIDAGLLSAIDEAANRSGKTRTNKQTTTTHDKLK